MNTIEFYTQNLEYKIRFKKEKRFYFLSKFSQYKITIEFIDSIEQTILTINTTEKEFVEAIENLSNFIDNYYNNFINSYFIEKDDIINFNNNNGDFSSYFIYLAMKNPYTDHPSDEDDSVILSFYHSDNKNNNVLRLSLEFNIEFLSQVFTYNMFLLVEDIPYLQEVIDCNLHEYLDYCLSDSFK